MAGLEASRAAAGRFGFLSQQARRQYAALAWVQSRVLINSLRTRRGGLEFGARILTGFIFTVIALGPAVGMGFAAWAGISHGRSFVLSMLLWVLFLVWQLFAALAPALAGQNPELSHLLRYPVMFGSWILLYIVYGLAAPSTLIGILWATAIGIGVVVARPDLLAGTALTLTIFVLFNLLLSRMILAWIERWMAQRRTREIVTGILLLAALGAQALNPAFHQSRHGVPYGMTRQKVLDLSDRIWNLQRVFPPGLATDSIAQSMHHRRSRETEALGWLSLYSVAAGGLLALRLRSESRGESLSEAPRQSSTAGTRARIRTRALLDFSGPIAAVFEKDLRYLMRSGPMLYNLAAPLVMAVVFGGAMRGGRLTSARAEYALPIGIAWAFLSLTTFVCNNLGAEGEGIQFLLLSPTPLRTVILGKNLLHVMLLLLEGVLISVLVVVRFGMPSPSIAAATFAWLLFAIPANLAVGNLLSINMPYRINLARLRRESGAVGNSLTSMLTQFGFLAAGASVLVPCALLGHTWLATPVFLVLAAISLFVYLRVLGNVDRMIDSHRESITLQLMKTS